MSVVNVVRRDLAIGTVILILCTAGLAFGQAPATAVQTRDEAAAVEAEAAKKAHREKLIAFAQSFKVYGSEARENEATLTEQPIFTWANPQRQAVGGSLFMWTLKGRPHATMGVWNFTHEKNQLRYEMQSLSPEPFDAIHELESDWSPRTGGLDFVEFAKADAPATSKIRRKLQMKQLAREFTSTLYKSEEVKIPLRLLPEPIYRYPAKGPDEVVDGAMFSFAQGTDPEVFLIIEARERGDKTSWYYGLAPSTVKKVVAMHGEKQVMTNGVDAAGQNRVNTFTFRSQAVPDEPVLSIRLDNFPIENDQL